MEAIGSDFYGIIHFYKCFKTQIGCVDGVTEEELSSLYNATVIADAISGSDEGYPVEVR